MIEIVVNESYGWRTALRALRRPFNREREYNWDQSVPNEDDLRIMKALILSGDDHAKVMRMIGVGLTVKAPRYWFLEFDTYRLGRFDTDCEMVSESTMHWKMSKEFLPSDFDMDGYDLAPIVNKRREQLLDKQISIEGFKANMPEGLLQTRDVLLNYQALRHIYHGRKDHRLSQWKEFCEFIKTLPYSELITLEKGEQCS